MNALLEITHPRHSQLSSLGYYIHQPLTVPTKESTMISIRAAYFFRVQDLQDDLLNRPYETLPLIEEEFQDNGWFLEQIEVDLVLQFAEKLEYFFFLHVQEIALKEYKFEKVQTAHTGESGSQVIVD